MTDDLQSRLDQQLADASHVCSGTDGRHHRPTYMPVDRDTGERYCPRCRPRARIEKPAKKGKKPTGAQLAFDAQVWDNGTRPGGACNTTPAAEHDACRGGGDA